MKKSNNTLFWLIIMVSAINTVCMSQVVAGELELTLCRDNEYRLLTKSELNYAEAAFSKILQSPEAIAEFKLPLKHKLQKGVAIFTEKKSKCQGLGSYLINYASKNKVLLQSPHSFFDTGTGLINKRLFLTGQIYSSAWNSVSRYANKSRSENSSDLSRGMDSLFMRFSLAFAKNGYQGRIIQLHGFNKKKRKTGAGRTADIIISNGTKFPSKIQKTIYYCLREKFPKLNVLLYPYEINELGATGNSVGKRLREIGFEGFVHVEMNYSFRMKAKKDEHIINQLVECFTLI